MNNEQARDLIKKTFPQSFDKNTFNEFISNLLNQFDTTKAASMAVPDAFAPHIRSCVRLGTYKSPEGEFADVLIVKTTEPWKLERTRTALRDFVAHKLKRDESYKEAGLVAFIAPDARSWRFSYVRMEYASKRDPKTGKIAAEERLTPARRYSYLVGESENCHTAQSRFLDLLKDTENNPTLLQLEDAFSVEAVTEEFFEQYKPLFLDLKDELDCLAKKDKIITAEFAAKNINTSDFAKKLMGQIVFLYFLQKKGWLGAPKAGDWGDGPRDFLRQLFDGKFGSYKNFFNDVLEPLFYDTLATDRGHEAWCKTFKCRIPFLNGGLFEPLCGYNWNKTDIIIPNSLFSNTKTTDAGDSGTGILDVFDRYNFTVNEAEPLEKDVAIDPEMLGKVFEKLLEVKERKSKGSYYTPREIVHYMCQESLINYLDTAVNKGEATVSRADIEVLIHLGEQFSFYEAAKKSGTIGKDYPSPPKSIEQHARLIDDLLDAITVCDPAVGSGAFPVGMMTEIVRARAALTPYFNDISERTLYDFKRHAIQNCLYGVDIDPGAVEIAKLRLWLSLIVDEEDVKWIKPLPNLDYKIMQGNSLTEEYEGIRLFDEKLISSSTLDARVSAKERILQLQNEAIRLHSAGELTLDKKREIEGGTNRLTLVLKKLTSPIKDAGPMLFAEMEKASKKAEELRALHSQFFMESRHDEKEKLKKRIGLIEWDLIEATLREEGKESALKTLEQFKKANLKPFFLWKLNFSEVFQNNDGFDIIIANPPYGAKFSLSEKTYLKTKYEMIPDFESANYFMFRSFELLGINGIKCFIAPNTWLANHFGKKMRETIIENWQIQHLSNCSGYAVFESASVRNCISICRKNLGTTKGNIVFSTFEKNHGTMNFRNLDRTILKAQIANWLTMFSQSHEVSYLLTKIQSGAQVLSVFADVSQGLIPYDKYRGHTDYTIKNRIWHADHRKDSTYKKELQGGDIDRYFLRWNGATWISYGKWLAAPRDPRFFKGERILIREITNPRILATYTKEEFYNTPSILNVASFRNDVHPLYLLAIINSKLMSFYHWENSPKAKKGLFPKILVNDVRRLPVKTIGHNDQQPFIQIVAKIIALKNATDYKTGPKIQESIKICEKKLDTLIFDLYNLTPKDILAVEQSIREG